MAPLQLEVEPTSGLAYLRPRHASTDGSLVLLLHGFPDSPHCWQQCMEALAASGYRPIAPYLPGYGPSLPPPSYTPLVVTQQLLTLARALQRAPCVVVGHDWGAVLTYFALGSRQVRCAVTLSVPHPKALLRFASTHPGQLLRSAYMGYFQLPHRPERALRERSLVSDLWSRWSPGFIPPAGYVEATEACIVDSLPGPLQYYRALPHALKSSAHWRALAPSSVPRLHLHGVRDGCIAAASARHQARYGRGPLSLRLLDAGHFLPLECASEVSESVLEFMATHRE